MSLQWIEGRYEATASGRSRVEITCPCCGLTQWAYLWSLAGGGKRCENKVCRAMFEYMNKGTTPKFMQPQEAA